MKEGGGQLSETDLVAGAQVVLTKQAGGGGGGSRQVKSAVVNFAVENFAEPLDFVYHPPRVGMQIRSEFNLNSANSLRIRGEIHRIRSANLLKVTSAPPLPHRQFVDFSSADFSEFFAS